VQKLVIYVIRPKDELLRVAQKYPAVNQTPYVWQFDEWGYSRWREQDYLDARKLLFLATNYQHLLRYIATKLIHPEVDYLKEILGTPPFSVAMFDRWWTIERIFREVKVQDSLLDFLSLETLNAVSSPDNGALAVWLEQLRRYKTEAINQANDESD
jgi:hypothetical protein